jgi:hypothetical protein
MRRRTFNDLSRRTGADAIVIRSITGHVTERMREHDSTVALDENARSSPRGRPCREAR